MWDSNLHCCPVWITPFHMLSIDIIEGGANAWALFTLPLIRWWFSQFCMPHYSSRQVQLVRHSDVNKALPCLYSIGLHVILLPPGGCRLDVCRSWYISWLLTHTVHFLNHCLFSLRFTLLPICIVGVSQTIFRGGGWTVSWVDFRIVLLYCRNVFHWKSHVVSL